MINATAGGASLSNGSLDFGSRWLGCVTGRFKLCKKEDFYGAKGVNWDLLIGYEHWLIAILMNIVINWEQIRNRSFLIALDRGRALHVESVFALVQTIV